MITLDTAKAQGPSAIADGRICFDQRTPGPLTCTLLTGHDGIHVAHGPKGTVMGAWADDDTDATDL